MAYLAALLKSRFILSSVYVVLIISSGLSLTGCEGNNAQSAKSKAMNNGVVSAITSENSTTQNSDVSVPETKMPGTKQAQVANDVAQRLDISYARLAANQNDVCPKLLEFKYASQSLVRNNERLSQATCKYYIYLNQGERLRVASSENMKAELVEPINYDFANGEFEAPRFDRYTIEVSYNGTRYNPQNFAYDIILTKNPTIKTS